MVESMPSVGPARHALYSVLQDVLGEEHADTLMTHLPQHRSDEVATGDDIARLETRFDRMDDRFDRMEDRIDQLAIEVREMNGVMRDQLRTYSLGTIGAMTALTAIFSLVVTFFA
jgi:outer membrane murein-binding lipoprotein Lpp